MPPASGTWLPRYRETLALDLLRQLWAIRPYVLAWWEKEEQMKYIAQEWNPVGWMQWWYHTLDERDRAALALTCLRGDEYGTWLPYLQAHFRNARPPVSPANALPDLRRSRRSPGRPRR